MFMKVHERLRNKEDGFTLIELMVVVLIIAILIAVAIPTFLGARKRAQDRSVQSNAKQGLTAAKTFYTDGETFVGFNAAKGEELEPPLLWANVAAAGDVPVGTTGIITAETGVSTIQIIVQSASGKFFCVRDNTASGTTYGSGAAYGDVDAAADCAATKW
jgi:type IV pilus assembly protein PilA